MLQRYLNVKFCLCYHRYLFEYGKGERRDVMNACCGGGRDFDEVKRTLFDAGTECNVNKNNTIDKYILYIIH